MKFECKKLTGKRINKWNGEIARISGTKTNFEMEVSSRGTYFEVIFGTYSNRRHYICIPNKSVGCEIASFSDVYWNVERLSNGLNKFDAITIATALKEVEDILNG